MSDFPDPGPFGADTDDAVSALIDGELAGFAADNGLDLADVQATLEQWGGLDARRARLEAGRDALVAPDPLDPQIRAAMVAAALAEPTEAPVVELAPRRRPAAVLARIAAAAAVLLVGLGGVLAFQAFRTDDEAPTARTPSTTAVETPAVGDAAATPAAAVTTAAAAGSTTPTTASLPASTGGAAAPAAVGLGEVADPIALQSAVTERLAAPGALPPPACPDLALFPAGTTVTLRAAATVNGRAAEVNAAEQNGRVIVFVVDPGTCSVLSAIAF